MSLFSNLGQLGFNGSEISMLGRWRNVLKATGLVGKAIEKNCELETRVNDAIRVNFLKNILRRFENTKNPIDAIQNAVSRKTSDGVCDPLLLNGPVVEISLSDKFGQLVMYEVIFRFSKDDSAETIIDTYEIPSKSELESRQLTIDPRKLPNKPYSNDYGFLWATDANLINRFMGIDELCCELGLSHIREGILMLKILYSRNSVSGPCRFPTIVEGRDSPSFQPAPVNAEAGYTRNLRNNEAQHPEWVHSAIPMHQVEVIDLAVQGNNRVGSLPDNYLWVK